MSFSSTRLPWLRPIGGVLLSAALAFGLVPARGFGQDARGRGHQMLSCSSCHNTHNPKGRHLWPGEPPQRTERGTLLLAGEALCYSCHKASSTAHFFEPGSSHPINVVPSSRVTVPRELGTTYVEGLGSVITCTSCHTPHGSSPKLLKITNAGDKLCLACHRFN